MSLSVRCLWLMLGFAGMAGLAQAQEPTEVLEPGGQQLPPLEGSNPTVVPVVDDSAPAPDPSKAPASEPRDETPQAPGSEQPSEPPLEPGPSGAIGEGPSNETNGLIAILRSDGAIEGRVEVLLKGPEQTTTLNLNDAGKPPDVTANDGLWAGLAETAPLSGTATVSVGEETRDAGPFSWGENDRPRELKLSWGVSGVTLSTTTGIGGAEGAGPSLRGRGPTASTTPSTVAAPTPAAASMPASASTATTTVQPPEPAGRELEWMGAIALIVSLAALGMGFLRKPAPLAVAEDPPELPPLPPRVREVGILGSGTPSLSDGMSVWLGPDALTGPLLATLARNRAVVVATAPEDTLPPVPGCAVFHVQSLQPEPTRAAVEAILARGALSVCVVILPKSAIDDSVVSIAERSLPEGVGCVIFGETSTADAPTAELGPAPGGVSVTVGGRPLRRLEVGPRGFVLT